MTYSFKTALLYSAISRLVAGILLCFPTTVKAQSSVKGTLQMVKRSDTTITLLYSPPSLLRLPENIRAAVVYKHENDYHYCAAPLFKNGDNFKSVVKLPAKVIAVVAAVTDQKGMVLDNNETGYRPSVFEKGASIPMQTYAETVELLSDYAWRILKLNRKSAEEAIISIYQQVFKDYPELKKNDPDFRYYLRLMYSRNQDSMRPVLNQLADSLSTLSKNEKNWGNARFIYKLLGEKYAYEQLERKTITQFPNGTIAQDIFLDSLERSTNDTESTVLAKLEYYIQTFPNTSERKKYVFYNKILHLQLDQLRSEKLIEYEELINKPAVVANSYEYYAEALLTQEKPSKNKIHFAGVLLQRAIRMVEKQLQNSLPEQNDGTLNTSYQKLLYQYVQYHISEKRFDSAFHFAESMAATGIPMNEEMYNTYLTVTEQVKGPEYAYQFLLQNINNNEYARFNLQHLKRLSAVPGKSGKEADSLRVLLVQKINQQQRDKVLKQMGNFHMREFALQNLNGDSVATKSLKGKTIVLDFWASWCRPCLATIPAMKQYIDQYENDSTVAILLIDTYEFDTPENTIAKAKKLINDNKYFGRVLIDQQHRIARLYHIESVPQQIVIAPSGEIFSVGETDDLRTLIEVSKGR